MSNSSSPFSSRGTRIYHGVAGGAIAVCRLVARNADGHLVACPTTVRPQGVSPVAYATGDPIDYHRLGICSVETDGSAAVGDDLKSAADGSGKAIKDSSPGFASAGKLLTLDATTNIGDVELYF